MCVSCANCSPGEPAFDMRQLLISHLAGLQTLNGSQVRQIIESNHVSIEVESLRIRYRCHVDL